MKKANKGILAAALVSVASLAAVQSHAGLFKLDFSMSQNRSEDVTLSDWDTFADWSFADFPDGVATWKLTDFSTSADRNTNVALTIMDNAPLATQVGAPALGMGNFNPDPQGLDVVYDGIQVPAVVKDDYLFRDPDTAGTEMLFRFANLAPGQYHVTLMNDRVDDPNGQYGKLWIDDIDGRNEPAAQNTGDYAANPLSDPNNPNSARVRNPLGHPQTLVVNIKAGDSLWYAHMEDGIGGISGMIIRSWVDSDGDGMPDEWEAQWGLNPQDPSDAVKDPNGNGLSNLLEYQSALDPGDTTRPTIRSAVANSLLNQVVITFSKPIFSGSLIPNDPRDATIATNLANYSISPALAIIGVAVKGNAVTLTTAKPTAEVTAYTLTVNNLRDANNWPVAPNSTVSFSMGAASTSTQPLIYQWITIAGKAGSAGTTDGTNSGVRFSNPWGVALDRDGNLIVGDGSNATIRKLAQEGTNWVSSTIAGKAGSSGSVDGTNGAARFGSSGGAYFGQPAVDGDGNIFLPDYVNHTIRKISPVGTNWVTTTIAGKAGSAGSVDGTNAAARFKLPNAVALDSAGNLYVADGSHTIRKMTRTGADWMTTTIAGKAGSPGSADGTNSGARFNFGHGLEVLVADRGGNLYVTDCDNNTIRKLAPDGTNWVSSTLAGKAGVPGNTDGANSAARFTNPAGIAVDSVGNLYVANMDGGMIRKLTAKGTNWVTTTIGGKAGGFASADGTNSVARFYQPGGLTADNHGNLYVGDIGNNTIRKGVPLPIFQSVTAANDRMELMVNTAPGQTVQVQYTSDLASASWTNLGNPVKPPSGTISATDTPDPGQPRFYRALVVSP